VDGGEAVDVEVGWAADNVPSIFGKHRLADYGLALQEGLLDGEAVVINDALSDPRTAKAPEALVGAQARALVNIPVRQQGRTVGVLFVHANEPRAWGEEILVFIRNVADRLEVGMARLQAEAEQRILNQELSHRLKNTFAMVQAIASQTLKGVSEQDAVEEFTKRIHSLSAAHDVLLQQSWAAARIRPVIDAVLGVIALPGRFIISGPDINLGSRAALSLSMLLHELATNAVKHGALSVEKGRVTVSWRVDDGTGETELVLEWIEVGGPAAREPDRRGFGSRLIRMGLVGTGGSNLRFLSTGLHAEFKAPLAQVQVT
jgi:two-component sensor histidine kinase